MVNRILYSRFVIMMFVAIFTLIIEGFFNIGVAGKTLQVGPGKQYATPSAAAAVATDGDVIEIDAVDYVGDVANWWANNLTIRGVGGRPHLIANGANAEGKGIWVIKGNNTTVENIEFSGATVPDENGAGIRQEGSGLTVRNCYFHDNENGILGGGDSVSEVVIEYTEFSKNGFGDGFTHNIYIGDKIKSFTFQFSYSHHAKIGHNVKSRARENYILYNRIMDEENGTSSYAIDLPNGGTSYIVGNLIQQGPDTDNSTIVSYGAEGLSNPSNDLYIVNNTIVNDRPAGTFIFVNSGAVPAVLINNLFVGPGTVLNGPGVQITNLVSDGSGLIDRTGFDYHLKASSPAIDTGSDPGSINGIALTPAFHYVHTTASEQRVALGPIDIGAYEFGNNPTPVELFSFMLNASQGSIILNWTTASETNNYGFEIERKKAGADFDVIGFVPGKGTTNLTQDYTFVDKSVQSSVKYGYRLKQIDLEGSFEYSQELYIEVGAPTEFRLLGNHPNPFNPVTAISFEIPFKSNLTLMVYDISGRTVRTLLSNEVREAGRYSLPFVASGLSSGVYIYRLNAGSTWSQIGKMLLIK